MKTCLKCGKESFDTASFCIHCGTAFPATAEPKTSAASAPSMAVPPQTPPVTPMAATAAYAAPSMTAASIAERKTVGVLKTNRSLLKYILLSIITLGIYSFSVMYTISTDINLIAFRYDGKKTMNFCAIAFIFSALTLGIAPLVWYHRISDRIGNELNRRGISYKFSSGTFWGWNVLGSLIIVGPFIYAHKLMKSMNLLCGHYNVNG